MPGLSLKLIVGLGNPGEEYARTRHNSGFWFVEELARRHGGAFRLEPRHHGELARTRIAATELWLLKPMGFMNRSGAAVQSVAAFYKAPAAEILVAYDDLDLPAGVARLREGGGAGGHNGMRDVIAQLGADFWRMRLGIGHPGDREKVLSYVLSRPAIEEDILIRQSIADAADIMPLLLAEGPQQAMHRLHTNRESV
ncbi:MAG TPA: aminoacyl-tRNA hydrolase [Steroidobacteraceae bacterium]|jgi:PTH1 family peptidyl-tRNA hydrolase|nr:aminoacyl-tRNA hydrolase [Steroidobacteraceae bacterium]